MSINPWVFGEEQDKIWLMGRKEGEGARCTHHSDCLRSLPTKERLSGVGSAENSGPEEHHGEEA